MWDPTTVLDFMSRSGANSDLNLATLSQKLVTSIALATLFRVSRLLELRRIPLSSITMAFLFLFHVCVRRRGPAVFNPLTYVALTILSSARSSVWGIMSSVLIS